MTTREPAPAAALRLIGQTAMDDLNDHGIEVRWVDDGAPPPRPLLVVSEIAAICQVDPKTIHNWVKRGALKSFRTPGKHLRFKADDVVVFLEACGYSVPEELKPTK